MIRIDPVPSQWSLGIDTSAYTTSVAAVSSDGHWIRQDRRLLNVPGGNRGLRPSEALFQHVQNLPALLRQVMAGLPPRGLLVVGVSKAPRPTPDSYLPPFLAGVLVAQGVALGAGVSLVETTHQEGHIRAGLADAGLEPEDPFFALHISGGTTELVRVDRRRIPWQVELVGGSDDLYAGQMVDRIGVLMGLSFPAGPALDELAETAEEQVAIPWSRPRRDGDGWWTSFSGPESAARRAYAEGVNPSGLALGVLDSIAQSLGALVMAGAEPAGDLLVVGGVAANTHIRRVMRQRLADAGFRVGFASPALSRDNAVGVAFLAYERWARDIGEVAR